MLYRRGHDESCNNKYEQPASNVCNIINNVSTASHRSVNFESKLSNREFFQKTNKWIHFYYYAACLCSFFGRNWRLQKSISKLSDLYKIKIMYLGLPITEAQRAYAGMSLAGWFTISISLIQFRNRGSFSISTRKENMIINICTFILGHLQSTATKEVFLNNLNSTKIWIL